jgi:hypothetical protein
MQVVEMNYWLDQASEEQRGQVRAEALKAYAYWLTQGCHPLDTLVAQDEAISIEIIAQGGLRVIGRA